MELRDLARLILSGNRIEDKLFEPVSLSDNHPGSAEIWTEPVRPPGLEFTRHNPRKDKLPSHEERKHPDKVAACLHRFAGHELLAVEIMAYALLAFPEAPRSFRMGVANTLREEQQHVRLYMKRMEELGITLGDLPLYQHFWAFTKHLTSPIEYVSMMSLTFEMANLDFAPQFGASFKSHGDLASFAIMEQILKDEISHVSFGMTWLKRLKEKDKAIFDTYKDSLGPILTPKRSRGPIFNEEARKKCRVPGEWINEIKTL
jgi:uncharacterized ferritin-like protein (DUF455 family)